MMAQNFRCAGCGMVVAPGNAIVRTSLTLLHVNSLITRASSERMPRYNLGFFPAFSHKLA